MPKQKKNLIRLLTISLAIFSCACISLPSKPEIEICVLDVPNNEVSCARTNGEHFEKSGEATYNAVWGFIKRASFATRFPLEYMDRGLCLRPGEYSKSQKYTHELEIYIQTRCKGFADEPKNTP
jgi:hypothetical protein